ncbi:urease accessory protein UreF [Actinocorallia sp. A-T 12471]|uniref:urease accessory protein UreF n=1 Tax=Actinocorallia sp. A-T 12471 TaxID=3089813 RepID=UPI0029CB6322|nr:urease accessory UreF family protein [Actinocorallia sp. A-T 12471]MDX6740432.1 urease accessory UreF family protein [Actinocorallia sp. A-T 12471]
MSDGQGGADLGPLLAQFQLTDSGFPSGMYTLSHGLEGYAQLGLVGPDGLRALLTDLLYHSVGPADAAALVLAHRAVRADDWDRLVEVDRRLHAIKLSREQRTASVRTGRQVLDTAASAFAVPEGDRLAGLVADRTTPGNHAVVVGTLYAGLDVPVERAVAGDLYAFAASWAAAAVRLARTDFRRAQALLREVRPDIAAVAATALAAADPRDLHGAAFVADTVSAAHERAQARLFVT